MTYSLLNCVSVLIFVFLVFARASLPPTCDSPIYCHGKLLHVVQLSGVFVDSKTFVDMTMRHDADEILSAFERLLRDNNETLTKGQVAAFVDENFSNRSELEDWTPQDYNALPVFLQDVADLEVRTFAQHIVSMWPKLSKKLSRRVHDHPERHSLIPLPQGIIIPGGRFRESYYWDTYWIIKGLLVCDMTHTVRGLLDNFVHLVKTFGFIPNGGRIYYMRRSQPPLFTAMSMAYFQRTGDIDWLRKNIAFLEREILHWQGQMIEVNGKYKMGRYLARSTGPRAESYKEDYNLAMRFTSNNRQRVYEDLKSGAESGWDFSSRWFANGDDGDLGHISTRWTLPVDLNAYLSGAFRDLSHFHSILGNQTAYSYWHEQHLQLKTAIHDVFWNATDGTWYDLDLKRNVHRVAFYVSNLTPLWMNVEHDSSTHEQIYDYLSNTGVFDFLGGTPSSLHQTGEQWDYPNAWAPLQDIIISSLHRAAGSKRSRLMAEQLSKRWINANMIGLAESGGMYEKYDAVVPGKYGGGGEYVVQAGFGWTNGFALDLINKFYTV